MFKRYWWVFLVMLPVGTMIGFLAAAVVTYVMPKKYESKTTIQIMPPRLEAGPQGSEFRGAGMMSPQFLADEFEKITSRNSLEKVVENLELVNRWNVDKETALRILEAVVSKEKIQGTDLISIRVRHTNKVDARDIAAEVVRAYKEYRTELEGREPQRMLVELNKAVRVQEDKVEERRKMLDAIMKGIVIKEMGAEESRADSIRKGQDTQAYIDAKRGFETEQELLNMMKLKQVAATLSVKVPNECVQIHEEPMIGVAPVSPNVALNLVSGTALGFLLSSLLGLPLIGILHRNSPKASS